MSQYSKHRKALNKLLTPYVLILMTESHTRIMYPEVLVRFSSGHIASL